VPDIMNVLRAEIRRLARKETKRRAASAAALAAGARAGAREAAEARADGRQVRFSPAWVRSHRRRLRMSRLLYARLLGVSAQTIMGWERGRTRPRPQTLRAWRAIRGMGIRELKAQAEGAASPQKTAPRARRRRATVARRRARRTRPKARAKKK
jgi:DNA-binding transcriptional regulator YiaG